ncbi:MAG: imidazole glycerol phosphate synthase subunit HisF [Methylococcales bacterium]|jgi:imidazole glycerol-phosphate synthase subunit HisF|nr:imidazole glycerol phosphate synthase subunit HisF [Methylococcales bacterium]
MRGSRVIPVLLISDREMIKTRQYKKPVYVGDPLNIIRIFNDKEVDELMIIDIGKSKTKVDPDYDYIQQMAEECFLPLCYGGGVSSIEQMQKIYQLGVEKIALNLSVHEQPNFIKDAVSIFGSQSVVVSMDVKSNWRKVQQVVKTAPKIRATSWAPLEYAEFVASLDVGELLVNVIDREGCYCGYDLVLLKAICQSLKIPVIINGGASSVDDFVAAVDVGASAVAAGSMFIFTGKHQAVLVSYPPQSILNKKLQ